MIGKKFSFVSLDNSVKLPDNHKEILKKNLSLETENNLLVLDTNILLRLYCIPLDRQKQILDFLNSQKDNIYISFQVQKEFKKHREHVLTEYLPWVYKHKYPQLKMPISLEIKRFLDKPNEKTYHKIKSQIEFQNKLVQYLLKNDSVMSFFESCHLLPSLQIEEQTFLKEEFEIISKDKKSIMFPGKGDIALKQKNKIGDYIIFHEILKLMKEKEKHGIFFTVDTSKGDWLDKQKESHLHYLEKSYEGTQHFFIATDGTRWLEQRFKTHLDPFPLLSEQKLSDNLNILTKDLLIIHPSFGKGRIINVYNHQNKEMVYVQFDKIGEKRLIKQFSKLQIMANLHNFHLINH